MSVTLTPRLDGGAADNPSIPQPPPLPPEPAPRSQADEALRRVIATPAAKSPKLPADPAARRRAIELLGW